MWSRDERSKRFVRVRCPVPGPPRSESVAWLVPFAGRSPGGLAVHIGFAVVMAQVRRPVPFRTRKLRPGRGDGTALERVWESSTPPHPTLGVPVERNAPGTPFFCLLCRPADRSPLPRGFPSGLSRCSASGLFHAPGDLERRGISGISGEPLALIRWLNRLKNYALFRTQTLCRIEQNHVSRQSNSPAGRRPKLA